MQEVDMAIQTKTREAAVPPKLEPESETERVQIVAPASWVQRVEEWRRAQPRIPSKSEAIRILVDRALSQGKK
jgi:hypothetical protein